jgi:Tfp pilus assembly protein PilW
MKRAGHILKTTGRKRTRGEAGLSFSEVMVAIAILMMVVAAFAVFCSVTQRSLVSVTAQATFDQAAGQSAEFIVSRIRLANTVSNDAAGDTLTLSFDDDRETDSDGDRISWNDKDHFEVFQFADGDNNATSLPDNTIIYKANAALTNFSVLVPSSVRKLSNLPIFSVSSNLVNINFGLLNTNMSGYSQAAEIRTQAVRGNKTQ